MNHQRGFIAVLVVIALALVIAGAAGYAAVTYHNDTSVPSTTSETSTTDQLDTSAPLPATSQSGTTYSPHMTKPTFSVTKTTGAAPLIVSFSVYSDQPVPVVIDYGDGTEVLRGQTGLTPCASADPVCKPAVGSSHAYTVPGTYSARLYYTEQGTVKEAAAITIEIVGTRKVGEVTADTLAGIPVNTFSCPSGKTPSFLVAAQVFAFFQQYQDAVQNIGPEAFESTAQHWICRINDGTSLNDFRTYLIACSSIKSSCAVL